MIKHQRRFESWSPAGYDGLFDWDFLLPALEGTRCQPMDFDCVIERRGRFLVFETKIPGKEVPQGQQITLDAALKTGNFCVMLLEGKTPATIQAATWCDPFQTLETGERFICDWRWVVDATRQWFQWASGFRYPIPK